MNLILRVITTVDNKVKKIETKLSKLDAVQAEVNTIALRLCPLERALKETQAKYTEIENSVTDLSNICDGVEERIDREARELDSIKRECIENKSEIKELKEGVGRIGIENLTKTNGDKEKIEQLRDVITDLRCRSMKSNLIFTGLTYNRNENCEEKLRNFLYHALEIEHFVELGNVHRFKGKLQNGARPIVARFLYHNKLEMVLKLGYMPRAKPFGIKEQFPEEIEKNRQKMYGVMKRAKQEGRHVSLVRDKLYIEGELYIPAYVTGDQDSTNTRQSPMASDPQRTPSQTQNVRQANKRPKTGYSPNSNLE